MIKVSYDVCVIGGGPAGLAAAISSEKNGARTALIDREEALGGILKQCIHDGFGLLRFKKQLSGPNYAQKFIDEIKNTSVDIYLHSFVSNIEKTDEDLFLIETTTSKGLMKVLCKSVIIATGCRERTFRQIAIHGTRPSGIFCAGTAQQLVNRMGHLPGKRVVILGSGDIGLIMARRLTLEGAKVLGVYEIKNTPSGLDRNINQCLNDFEIPLHLSTTITSCEGEDRLKAVNIAKVDDKLQVIKDTEEHLECDTLIVSVGLIPEIEIVENLKINIDDKTKGLLTDQDGMSSLDGLFTCGNACVVYDLVDLVSMQSEIVGKAAAKYSKGTKQEGKFIDIKKEGITFLVSPQRINLNSETDLNIVIRVNKNIKNGQIIIKQDDNIIFKKNYPTLKMPHMEQILIKKDKLLSSSPIVVYSGERSNSNV